MSNKKNIDVSVVQNEDENSAVKPSVENPDTNKEQADEKYQKLLEENEKLKLEKMEAEKRAYAAESAAMALKYGKNSETSVCVEEKKEERVKIKLFKDSKDYKDDVVVGLNGTIYQIQRGIEVEVPAGVAEILLNSQRQEEKTAEMIEMLVTATEEKEKEMNM